MRLKRKKIALKSGLAPGSAVFTGIQKMKSVSVTIINYTEDSVEVHSPDGIASAIELTKQLSGIIWINIDGLHDVEIIESLCSHFGIHKLTIEDILSVNQRPKLEEHSENLHIVLKMLNTDSNDHSIDIEQVSFLYMKNILITFQEKSGDVFESVRNRINDNKGYIRKRGADYLLYALIDSIVDRYFFILETIGEKLDELETDLLENPDKNSLNDLHRSRKEMLSIRRAVYPARDVISNLSRIDETLISAEMGIFLRDLYDHTVRVIETIELFRDTTSGLLDLYMNSVSNKMNEIMKTLTIIATIFIPLTFIVGVYGMNFANMPELNWKYAYFGIWGIMVAVFIAMLIYFRRKHWI
ncbi:MAG: magnesium/cobalt transporter CorA [Spirochaetes bacterium]|jgi:magnesium transporter|nr:magnesium/cobalt transporter CorA [Spirochaetota bacterium]